METLIPFYHQVELTHKSKDSLLRRFYLWCTNQEENRLLWLAVIIAVHGCILTPLTAVVIVSSGYSMFLWAIAIAAMAAPLVTNLAALPTKITLPTFFISLVMDLTVIIYSAIGYLISTS